LRLIACLMPCFGSRVRPWVARRTFDALHSARVPAQLAGNPAAALAL